MYNIKTNPKRGGRGQKMDSRGTKKVLDKTEEVMYNKQAVLRRGKRHTKRLKKGIDKNLKVC